MHIKDKTAVLTYLDNATLEKLKAYANGRRITVNQAVEKVVVEFLSYQEIKPENDIFSRAMEENIEELSTDIEHVKTVIQCNSLKLEKHEEMIFKLESEIQQIKSDIDNRESKAIWTP